MSVTHTAKANHTSKGVSISFNPPVSPGPGVYQVVHKIHQKTFYVGEGGDLTQRLKTLFRCYPSNNPHPCQSAFQRAYGSFPTPDQFCNTFDVIVHDTTGKIGRLEIEEELQAKHGSNNADFYRVWSHKVNLQKATTSSSKIKPVSHDVRITGQMRKTGEWVFSKGLAEQVSAKGELVRIIFPKNLRVDGCIGFSKSKYLNKARSALKEFVAKYPESKQFSVELGFEGETQTITIKLM